MKVDLVSPDDAAYDSAYCLSKFSANSQNVWIIGADAILHGLIKNAALRAGRLDSATIGTIYRDVPGHYAFVIRCGQRTVAVTDPYGIIKLYWFRTGSASVLCDAPAELAGTTVSLDTEAIKFFLVCGYTPSKHTFFQNIEKLEPCRVYEFEGGRLVAASTYARFGGEKSFGAAFLDRFLECMGAALDVYLKHYERGSLFLSGGIDSSFLYQLLKHKNRGEWTELFVGRLEGLSQPHKIDNDYDIEYSNKLAGEGGRSVTIAGYDFRDGQVLDDFIALRDAVFADYAPAMAYMGMARAVPEDQVIVNGQNADSILSFGSMGSPRFQSGSVTGLHGFFSRYFLFFGHRPDASVANVLARLLRWVYYRRVAPSLRPTFSDRSCFLGIGLHPQNDDYVRTDPVFRTLHRPDVMADWFEEHYLKPLQDEFGDLDHHARSMILYNRTYMQGSANRSTVVSALVQKRKVFLPFSCLSLLELMTNLQPDWRYAYYGKYPNIAVGRRLDLPKYIIDRCDPSNSDSSSLLYRALLANEEFGAFFRKLIADIDWSRYAAILDSRLIARLRASLKDTNAPASDMSLLLKLAWLESTIQKFRLV